MASAITVGMLAWTAFSLASIGIPWFRFLLTLFLVLFVCWGIGGIALLAMRYREDERRSPFFRMALGFVLAVTLITLLALTRMGVLAICIVMGALSLACWTFLMRQHAGGIRMPRPADARDWMMLAVLMRLCTAGSDHLALIRPNHVRFEQYWDSFFHLALVKEGLFRGLPVENNPMMAGVDWWPYHPAFHDFATILIKSTGIPVDPGFFGVVLPLLGVAFLASLMALTTQATGSRWSAYLTLAVLGAIPLLAAAYSELGRIGDYAQTDVGGLRWFIRNQPGTLGAMGAALSVALFARGAESGGRRCLMGSALLAAATISMKANTALALGPAFMCALVVLAWRKRKRSLLLGPSLAALSSAAICYLPTRGSNAAKVGIDLGAYAQFVKRAIRLGDSGPGVNFWGRVTEKIGLFGDALFLVGHLVGTLMVWRVFPAVLALLRRPRLPSVDREQRASATNTYFLWFLLWILVVAFTLVQIDVGRYSVWNLPAATTKNAAWVGAVLAGIGLYRLLYRVIRPRLRTWAGIVLLATTLGLVPHMMSSVSDLRLAKGWPIPVPVYQVLQQVERATPRDAVVAQNFDTVWGSWVSSISGRATPLERSEIWLAYLPDQQRARQQLVVAFYGATDVETARQAADDLGADYAIVGPDDPGVLLRAGEVVYSSEGWHLVKFPWGT